MWKKAQEDNPDPENMIPIPLLGPDALKNRLEAQQVQYRYKYIYIQKIYLFVNNLLLTSYYFYFTERKSTTFEPAKAYLR